MAIITGMSKPKSKPPKPEPKKMRACHRFVEKLARELGGDECQTLVDAGVPRSQLSNWRGGSKVTLDYAWMVAHHVGVSLDYLANDELDEPLPPELTSQEREILEMVRELKIPEARRRLLYSPCVPADKEVTGLATTTKERQGNSTPRSASRKPRSGR
jgi:transcriptional regulator with XRE-family HTH domain